MWHPLHSRLFFVVFALVLLGISSGHAQSYISQYQGGRLYSWDGRYLSKYQGNRLYEWDGQYLSAFQGSRLFTWDGRYLSRYQGSRIFQVEGSVPVVILALLAAGYL